MTNISCKRKNELNIGRVNTNDLKISQDGAKRDTGERIHCESSGKIVENESGMRKNEF